MCDFLYQTYLIVMEWHTRIENLNYIKDILQNIPFIIATVLIALLVQFLTYIDKDENKDLVNEIVKKKIAEIIPFREMTFTFIIVLILPGYLEYNYFILNIVVLIVYLIGIILLLRRSFSMWDYMMVLDVRETMFKKLLKNLELQDKDFVEIWRIIWSQTNSENIRDGESFKIWKFSLDKYFKEEVTIDDKPNIIAWSIDEFANYLENRTLTFFRREGYIDWLLESHYQAWKKSYSLLDGENIYIWSQSTDIFTALNNLLHKTLEIMINQNSSHVLHAAVDTHLEEYKDEVLGKNNHGYLEQWEGYFNRIFNASGIRENLNLWQGNNIPKAWKINSQNYSTSYVQRVICQFYLKWMFYLYLQDTKDSTIWSLNEVSEKLFPQTSAYLFARLLHLWVYQSSGMRVVIDQKMRFGIYSGGTIVTDSLTEKKRENQAREETYTLILKMLGGTYTKDNINKWIKELDILLGDKDKDEDYRRKVEFWKTDLTMFKKFLYKYKK